MSDMFYDNTAGTGISSLLTNPSIELQDCSSFNPRSVSFHILFNSSFINNRIIGLYMRVDALKQVTQKMPEENTDIYL
jgi:hypothetical protein